VITGGAGFIGSKLVDALLDEGDEVLVVENPSSAARPALRRSGWREAALAEAL